MFSQTKSDPDNLIEKINIAVKKLDVTDFIINLYYYFEELLKEKTPDADVLAEKLHEFHYKTLEPAIKALSQKISIQDWETSVEVLRNAISLDKFRIIMLRTMSRTVVLAIKGVILEALNPNNFSEKWLKQLLKISEIFETKLLNLLDKNKFASIQTIEISSEITEVKQTARESETFYWPIEDTHLFSFELDERPHDGECAITSMNLKSRKIAVEGLLNAIQKKPELIKKLIAPEIHAGFLTGELENILKSNKGLLTAYGNIKKKNQEEAIQKFCHIPLVQTLFIENFVAREKTWLSYQLNTTSSMDAIAEAFDLYLMIFMKKEDGLLKLVHEYKPTGTDAPKLTALLHTNEKDNYHFDRLNIEASQEEMLYKHLKCTLPKSYPSSSITKLFSQHEVSVEIKESKTQISKSSSTLFNNQNTNKIDKDIENATKIYSSSMIDVKEKKRLLMDMINKNPGLLSAPTFEKMFFDIQKGSQSSSRLTS